MTGVVSRRRNIAALFNRPQLVSRGDIAAAATANRRSRAKIAVNSVDDVFKCRCTRADVARRFAPGRIPEGLAGARFDIVVNATSAGLADVMPPLPREIFAPGSLAYEMVYGRRTLFMEFAAGCGAKAADGLGMLVEQAAESFFIWRGVRPATKPVIDLLRREGGGRRAEG